MLISDEYRLYYSFLSLEAEAMDLNVMRFFTDASEEAKGRKEYVGPRLLKTGHLNIIVRTRKALWMYVNMQIPCYREVLS